MSSSTANNFPSNEESREGDSKSDFMQFLRLVSAHSELREEVNELMTKLFVPGC